MGQRKVRDRRWVCVLDLNKQGRAEKTVGRVAERYCLLAHVDLKVPVNLPVESPGGTSSPFS